MYPDRQREETSFHEDRGSRIHDAWLDSLSFIFLPGTVIRSANGVSEPRLRPPVHNSENLLA